MDKCNNPLPILVRWENAANARYYEAQVECDLLGDMMLYMLWGRKYSLVEKCVSALCASYEEALKRLDVLCQRRQQGGYRLVSCVRYQSSKG